MVIAFNGRFLLKNKLEGVGYFTREVISELAEKHPNHLFYIIYDRPFEKAVVEGANIQNVVIPPPARHPLLWKYWFDYKIPAFLKRIKADVFVSTDGFATLRTKVPQCLVVHDLGFLHFPQGYIKSHLYFYKRYTPKFLKKASCIATVSRYSKDDIIEKYSIPPEKIKVIYSAAKEVFKPLSFVEKSEVKQQYTSGREYFIYAGSIHPRKNLINLLKAFSIFKKRQKSNWKLVLAGRYGWKNDEFKTLLKSYKYKEDVLLTGYIPEEEMAKLIASSYALVYPSHFEGFGIPVLEAMQCEVPVLTSEKSSMQEIAEDAALYFDPLDINGIADKMMLIYKDENLRMELIKKGKLIAEKYKWSLTADLLWQSIEEAAVSTIQHTTVSAGH
jgi:glycosyltransferase involved in cell wall biosynthesis